MGWYTSLRILVNSITFFILFTIAVSIIQFNWILGLLILIASLDALFDVLIFTNTVKVKGSLILLLLNKLTEGIAMTLGVLMILFAYIYAKHFASPFFYVLMFFATLQSVCAGIDSYTQFVSSIKTAKRLIGLGEKYVKVKDKKY